MKKLVGFYIGFLIMLFLVRFPFYLNQSSYQLSFLNIGQGDSVFIRTPDNCRILIDAGKPNTLGDNLINILPFATQKIDLVIISHPDIDHYGGLISLTEKYHFQNVILSSYQKNNSTYQTLLKGLGTKGSNLYTLNSRQSLSFCNLNINLTIYPSDNPNSSSIISHFEFPTGHTFFSAGDIGIDQEAQIIKSDFPLQADIYKSSHHGSSTSNSPDLLDTIKPDYTVVQSGFNNSYNHPHFSVIKTLKKANTTILRNDFQGQIDFFFLGSKRGQSKKLKLKTEY
jgi:competence protein ComEC